MATTRFKNTSNATWKTLRTIDTEWKFDIYGVTPKVIEGLLEELQFVSYSGYLFGDILATLENLTYVSTGFSGDADDRSGDIEASFENFTCEMSGTFLEASKGDIETTLENFTLEMVGDFWVNKLAPTLQEFIFESITAYSYIDTSLEYFTMEGHMASNIEASLAEFTCTMDSLFGASISGILQEFIITTSGDTNYVVLEPKLNRITAAMYSGAHADITLKRLQSDIRGSIVLQGDLKAVLRRMLFSSTAGIIMQVTLPYMDFDIQGTTPVITELTLETRTLKCTMHGAAETIESLLVTMRRLTMRAYGTQANPGDETTLEDTLKRLQITISGIQGYPGEFTGTLRDFIADFTASVESIDDFTMTLEELMLTMRAYSSEFSGGIIYDPTEDCEPFDTLEYGVV